MKGKSLSAIGLIALIAGALLIIFYEYITSAKVVLTGGILFVGVGVSNLIVFGQNTKESRGVARLFNQIANAAAIVLGICMLVFRDTFLPLVPFIFGLLVAVCSLWQFFLLAVGTRPYQMPAWQYLFPVLLAADAVYIFMQKLTDERVIVLATGIGIALMGLACVVEGSSLGMCRRRAIKGAEKPAAPETPAAAPAEAEAPLKSENEGMTDAEQSPEQTN